MTDEYDDSDHTPIPPPSPAERDSVENLDAIAAEDRAAREAANIPREASEPARGDQGGDQGRKAPDFWDRAGAWLIAHGTLPALALITIVIAIVHGRIFYGETAGDDLTFHYAESARLADCFARGDFDFWNPSANGGYASLYYYQAIPQLASAIPAAVFGNHLFWFQLSVVLPLIAAPACAYKGMRLLGATPWQSLAGAFCVAFMNGESRWGSGNAGTFVVGLYTQTWALCAFPLALGYAARWITAGTHLASAVAWGGFVFLCHPFGGISLAFAILMAWIANIVLAGVDHGLFRRTRAAARKQTIVPELVRSSIFAVLFAITMLPVALPLFIDNEGFGGFPHRVSDEVGPGFKTLWMWFSSGNMLDYPGKNLGTRLILITLGVAIVLVFARARFFRWLWAPALLYALFLGLGPNLGKIGDDLFPPVRFLGAMQTVLAMAVGAGVMMLGTRLWHFVEKKPAWTYVTRTALAAAAAALVVLIAVPGSKSLGARVRVFGQSDPKRYELEMISHKLSTLPQGRKLSGSGAENHWYNMLPYVWHRVPSTLQMGGGGLQASPNYDFLWSMRDHVKNAWIFDAPYLVFMNTRGKNIPRGETLFKTPMFEIRRLPSNGLVSPIAIVGVLPPGYAHDELGHKKAIEWVKGPLPIKNEHLVYQGFGGPGERPQGRTLRAWRQDSPGDDADIVAELEVEAPTTFVVRESWHPRWHAYIDGEEVPVRRVTPDFPAVDVPAGTHTLELRFERPWWAQAAWLAWPLPALVAFFVLRRRRRAAAAATETTSDDNDEAIAARELAIRRIVTGVLWLVFGVAAFLLSTQTPSKTGVGGYLIACVPLAGGVYWLVRGLRRPSPDADTHTVA